MTVDEVVEVLARDEQYEALLGALELTHDEGCDHCLKRQTRVRAWARERAAQIVGVHVMERGEEIDR